MTHSIQFALVTLAFISCNAIADGVVDLAKEKKCFDCHAIDKTMLGPSFQNIAKKYAGMKGTAIEADLISIIMSGDYSLTSEGNYHWGPTEMPSTVLPPRARPSISDLEAKALLDWILKQE